MADDPKPDPPTDPPLNPDPPTDPPTPPTPQQDPEVRGLIDGLNQRVETLENHLQTIIDIKPDSTPVRGPWTHRRFGGKS